MDKLTDEQKELYENLWGDLRAMYHRDVAVADNGIHFRGRIEQFINDLRNSHTERINSASLDDWKAVATVIETCGYPKVKACWNRIVGDLPCGETNNRSDEICECSDDKKTLIWSIKNVF